MNVRVKAFVATLLFGASLCPAYAGVDRKGARVGRNSCALNAQKDVARRHGFSETADASAGSKIYANPTMSQEADDAFDACIRKQTH